MGLGEAFHVVIEGERIELTPEWLGSPSMESLNMSSLYPSKCLIFLGGKEIDDVF
jgi:hypothetical protein